MHSMVCIFDTVLAYIHLSYFTSITNWQIANVQTIKVLYCNIGTSIYWPISNNEEAMENYSPTIYFCVGNETGYKWKIFAIFSRGTLFSLYFLVLN